MGEGETYNREVKTSKLENMTDQTKVRNEIAAGEEKAITQRKGGRRGERHTKSQIGVTDNRETMRIISKLWQLR